MVITGATHWIDIMGYPSIQQQKTDREMNRNREMGKQAPAENPKKEGIFPRHPALTPDHTYETQTLSMQSVVLEADGGKKIQRL